MRALAGLYFAARHDSTSPALFVFARPCRLDWDPPLSLADARARLEKHADRLRVALVRCDPERPDEARGTALDIGTRIDQPAQQLQADRVVLAAVASHMVVCAQGAIGRVARTRPAFTALPIESRATRQ